MEDESLSRNKNNIVGTGDIIETSDGIKGFALHLDYELFNRISPEDKENGTYMWPNPKKRKKSDPDCVIVAMLSVNPVVEIAELNESEIYDEQFMEKPTFEAEDLII